MTVTATLGAPHANRTLTIWAQPRSAAKSMIKANTTFTVTFSGDTWYVPASAFAAVKS